MDAIGIQETARLVAEGLDGLSDEDCRTLAESGHITAGDCKLLQGVLTRGITHQENWDIFSQAQDKELNLITDYLYSNRINGLGGLFCDNIKSIMRGTPKMRNSMNSRRAKVTEWILNVHIDPVDKTLALSSCCNGSLVRHYWPRAVDGALAILGPQVLFDLIEFNKMGTTGTRKITCSVFETLGRHATKALPYLIEKLQDVGESWEKKIIIRAIGKMGAAAEEEVPILTSFLHDENLYVRKAVYKALSRLGHFAMNAVPALGNALLKAGNWSEKASISRALYRIGGAAHEAIVPLSSTLVTCYTYGWWPRWYLGYYSGANYNCPSLCGLVDCIHVFSNCEDIYTAYERIKKSPRPVKVKPWKETL